VHGYRPSSGNVPSENLILTSKTLLGLKFQRLKTVKEIPPQDCATGTHGNPVLGGEELLQQFSGREDLGRSLWHRLNEILMSIWFVWVPVTGWAITQCSAFVTRHLPDPPVFL